MPPCEGEPVNLMVPTDELTTRARSLPSLPLWQRTIYDLEMLASAWKDPEESVHLILKYSSGGVP